MIHSTGEAKASVNYRTPSAGIFSRIPGLKWALLVIPLAYIIILLFVPMFNLFKLSFVDESGFTLEYLIHLLSESVYLKVLWVTLKISFLVTFVSLIITYPIAYLLIKMKSKMWKSIILGVTLIPFWISLLVRTFSWIVVLQNHGVVNETLMGLGIINEPLSLSYNTIGVVIALTHVMYPYMFLSLYSIMKGIDTRLLQAAQGLGAKPMKAFFQVFFPLSLPGILAGSLLVFVMSLGFFVAPALIGGSDDQMISMVIEQYINKSLNWHLASGLSLILFVVTMLIILIVFLVMRKNPIIKDVT